MMLPVLPVACVPHLLGNITCTTSLNHPPTANKGWRQLSATQVNVAPVPPSFFLMGGGGGVRVCCLESFRPSFCKPTGLDPTETHNIKQGKYHANSSTFVVLRAPVCAETYVEEINNLQDRVTQRRAFDSFGMPVEQDDGTDF